jgi:outer membrane protein TolC
MPKTMTRPHAPVAWSLTLHLLLASCTARHHERRADEVARLILSESEALLDSRLEIARRPGDDSGVVLVPGESPEEPMRPEPAPRAEARVLDLPQALELAVRGNRDHKARREALYLEALSLANVRHSFAPQLSLALGYLFSDADGLPESHGVGIAAGVGQRLPWGGEVSVKLNSDFSESAGDGSFSTSAGITLTQPLLRGAGAAISHESLIQAERDLVYAIRSFELQREDFSIEVARRFYDLVQRRQTIENLERNLEGLVFGRRQAEALFQVGRKNELEVLRARRSELGARDTLIGAQEDNLVALDRFRIFLGLPEEVPVDVQPDAPAYIELDFDVDQAIEVALANRLDLLNRQQQLEDARRGLRIAEDGLRPDLTLTAGFGTTSSPDPSFQQQAFQRDAITAGLSLGLPVDRVGEANGYRGAQVGLVQAQRSFEEFRDNLIVDIASAFRELERRKQSLDIQQELISGQAKNVKIAQLRFEQGDFSNRDVTEAKEALLEAQNRLIDERVNYEISRLGLLRDLGILFIDDRGMFKE